MCRYLIYSVADILQQQIIQKSQKLPKDLKTAQCAAFYVSKSLRYPREFLLFICSDKHSV